MPSSLRSISRLVWGGVVFSGILLLPGSAGARTLDAGLHTCRVFKGGLQCWGHNSSGQIGDGTTENALFAVDVKGMGPGSGVTAVALGRDHTCAIQAGALKCWGDGSLGQLGHGTNNSSHVPLVVQGMGEGVTAVDANWSHTCAVQYDALKCWGRGADGQLGLGTTESFNVPKAVPALAMNVTAVAAGASHTCAVVMNAAWCWGKDAQGALGNGVDGDSLLPIPVTGLGAGVTAIFAGARHSCALHNGALKCWGSGLQGQLGNDSSMDAQEPVEVQDMQAGVDDVAAGHYHTCAARADAVYCWGLDADGVLGDGGTTGGSFDTPQLVAAGMGVSITVAAGTQHSCYQLAPTLVNNPGQVRCWGNLGDGSLGTGDDAYAEHPVPVALAEVPLQASAGRGHTCMAVESAGTHELRCWGANQAGQLGTGSFADTALPSPVVSVGGVLATSGDLEVAAGEGHACARVSESALCWGLDTSGQRGDGAPASGTTNLAAGVAGLDVGVTAIAAGYDHSCAIKVNLVFDAEIPTLRCWGDNSAGQIGNTPAGMTPQPQPSPVTILGSGVEAVALGGYHSCAVQNGSLLCWGSNQAGQLGLGHTTGQSSPTAVPGLTGGVTDIALGAAHTCAIHGGALKCWGHNGAGQTGIGSPTEAGVLTPTTVPTMEAGVVSVAAGGEHTCALKSDGSLWCWGAGKHGQLGIGDLLGAPVPTLVPAVSSVVSISAGRNHTCAITDESGLRTLWCWGWRLYGRIGDGDLGIRAEPSDFVSTVTIFRDGLE